MNQSVSIKTQLQRLNHLIRIDDCGFGLAGLHPCLHADPAIHFTEGRVEFVKYK